MSIEKQYIHAFNNGYFLSEYEPKLVHVISNSIIVSNDYLRAFFAGVKQSEIKNERNHLYHLKQLRYYSNENEKEF